MGLNGGRRGGSKRQVSRQPSGGRLATLRPRVKRDNPKTPFTIKDVQNTGLAGAIAQRESEEASEGCGSSLGKVFRLLRVVDSMLTSFNDARRTTHRSQQ